MRRVYLILPVLLLGCARDNYTVIQGGPGSSSRITSDLSYCKHWAIDEHFRRQPAANTALGVFGAMGGALSAATQPAENNANS